MFYFYLFRCKDGTLYAGSTKDLKARELAHNQGKGAKYTHSRGGGKIVYFERFKTWGETLKREAQIKKWPRVKKLELIKSKK